MDTNTVLEVLTQPLIPAWVALLLYAALLILTAYVYAWRKQVRHKRRRPAVEKTDTGR